MRACAEPVFLDVGTGSGAISIAFMTENPTWPRGIAVDLKLAAASLAKVNARR